MIPEPGMPQDDGFNWKILEGLIQTLKDFPLKVHDIKSITVTKHLREIEDGSVEGGKNKKYDYWATVLCEKTNKDGIVDLGNINLEHIEVCDWEYRP